MLWRSGGRRTSHQPPGMSTSSGWWRRSKASYPSRKDVSDIATRQALLPNPLNMLLSEALFYNRLLLGVVASLKQLRRVLDGEQHPSPVTQCFARALLQNQVTIRPSVCWDTSGVQVPGRVPLSTPAMHSLTIDHVG